MTEKTIFAAIKIVDALVSQGVVTREEGQDFLKGMEDTRSTIKRIKKLEERDDD